MTEIRSILLLDDEPAVVHALRLVLQVLKYEVTAHTSPRDALESLRGEGAPPDLILCDLKMPGLSGIEVLQELRKINPAIPFVLMSAHATADDIERARREGAKGFLPKPWTPPDLERVIRALPE